MGAQESTSSSEDSSGLHPLWDPSAGCAHTSLIPFTLKCNSLPLHRRINRGSERKRSCSRAQQAYGRAENGTQASRHSWGCPGLSFPTYDVHQFREGEWRLWVTQHWETASCPHFLAHPTPGLVIQQTKDLGLEGSLLTDILYRDVAFLNLVDPISHDLLVNLARDLQCPKKTTSSGSPQRRSADSSSTTSPLTRSSSKGPACARGRRRAGKGSPATAPPHCCSKVPSQAALSPRGWC